MMCFNDVNIMKCYELILYIHMLSQKLNLFSQYFHIAYKHSITFLILSLKFQFSFGSNKNSFKDTV